MSFRRAQGVIMMSPSNNKMWVAVESFGVPVTLVEELGSDLICIFTANLKFNVRDNFNNVLKTFRLDIANENPEDDQC